MREMIGIKPAILPASLPYLKQSMSMDPSNTSNTAEVNSAEIGNPKLMVEVVTEMFFTYVRTDDFVRMSPEDRNKFVEAVHRLIGLFS